MGLREHTTKRKKNRKKKAKIEIYCVSFKKETQVTHKLKQK